MTTLVTTSGALPVIHAEITELLEGAWTARVTVDSDDPITGPVSLVEGLTTWVGVQKRGAQEHGRTIVLLVGGTGGLSGALGVKNYDSPFIADILADIMVDAGEVLSPAVSATLLAAKVERWSRRAGPGGLSLKQVTDETTADHWRIRRDGLVWLGAESYPAVSATFEFIEEDRDPAQDSVTIAPEENQILVAPGDSFMGRNVASVVTTIEPGSVRQVISWEPESGSTGDRLLGPMKTLVEAFVGRQIDYAKVYPSVVKLQNADGPGDVVHGGTLDLMPDDETIRGDGFKRIKITYGTPGMLATVPINARVNLYFQSADPKKPRAGLWEGSGVDLLTIGGGSAKVVVLHGDSVTQGVSMALWMTQVEVFINGLSGGTVAPLSTTFGLGTVTGTSSKLKTV